MLFHEIYGSYYRTVSAILTEAVKGTLTKKSMAEMVQKHAFGESFMSIPEGLTGERWRLIHQDLNTPLKSEPAMPLTLLQKRWLKALLLDPRIQLFEPDVKGLEDIRPLFTPDQFVYFDQYSDGDHYEDKDYIQHFRTILAAMQENQDLYIRYESRSGFRRNLVVTPHYLEYSEKDDRFRLYAAGKKRPWTLNLSRMKDCCTVETEIPTALQPIKERTLSFELVDERKALERVLLHFSHLRKETKRLDDQHYLVTLVYDEQDETEMVIRLLSFGPMIRVTAPQRMIHLLRERIEQQRELVAFFPGNDRVKMV